MKELVSSLWFDNQAAEATQFYLSLFENSEHLYEYKMNDTPSGDALVINFRLENLKFCALDGGPHFKLNPSISIMVNCETAEEVNQLHEKLTKNGKELIPLDSYPFSERYAWVEDPYGLTWQLMKVDQSAVTNDQKLSINFLFAGEALGNAEAALDYYQEVFKDSEIGAISNYKEGEAQHSEAKINYSEFKLEDQTLIFMDDGQDADYSFNEAFSLMIMCSTQAEIDYYWEKLSHVAEAEECGWLKDQFGVSWQVVPVQLDEFIMEGSDEEKERVTKEMLTMKKLDISRLEKAHYQV